MPAAASTRRGGSSLPDTGSHASFGVVFKAPPDCACSVLCVSACLRQRSIDDEMTTVFSESDSESGATIRTTLGTTTSTVTTAPLTTGEVSSSTTDTDTSTTGRPICNYDTICDVGETAYKVQRPPQLRCCGGPSCLAMTVRTAFIAQYCLSEASTA